MITLNHGRYLPSCIISWLDQMINPSPLGYEKYKFSEVEKRQCPSPTLGTSSVWRILLLVGKPQTFKLLTEKSTTYWPMRSISKAFVLIASTCGYLSVWSKMDIPSVPSFTDNADSLTWRTRSPSWFLNGATKLHSCKDIVIRIHSFRTVAPFVWMWRLYESDNRWNCMFLDNSTSAHSVQ